MTLSHDILKRRLQRPFRYLESVGSSNDIAKEWLQDAAPDGAAVIANEQLSGRGRKGRTWYTLPDVALAVSVILRPPSVSVARVGMVGALAVYEMAQAAGCGGLGLKWPNDVLVKDKKVAGILPEAVWEEDKAVGVLLGIGVNVRMDFSNSPLRDQAISLETHLSRKLDRADLLEILLQRIDYWYARIGEQTLFDTWKSRLNHLGQRVKVKDIVGLAVDVAPDGSLLVADEDGVVSNIQAGDIFLVRGSGVTK